MASKKAKKTVKVTKPKRPTAKRKPPAKPPAPVYAGGAPPTPPGLDKCNVPAICEFLDKLNDWLRYQFYPDYKALRIAVCNVEDQAFAGAGVPTKPPRFCSGGGTNEPMDPPKPPVW